MTDKKTVKVLLVDDEPGILTALEFLVRSEGYQVFTAGNGEQALALAQEHLPHLIVLDVMMPGLDGFQTALRIRAIPQLEDCRIIFLTAKGTVQDRRQGYDSGAEIYITKPFDNDRLMDAINELIEYG